MRRMRSRSNDSGMTLTEVLVSIGILGVVLAAMAASLISSFGGVQASKAQVGATQLANEYLEAFRSARWETLVPAPAPATPPNPDCCYWGAATVAPLALNAVASRDGVTYTAEAVSLAWVNNSCNDTATDASDTTVDTRKLRDYLRYEVTLRWQVKAGPVRRLTVHAQRAPTSGETNQKLPIKKASGQC